MCPPPSTHTSAPESWGSILYCSDPAWERHGKLPGHQCGPILSPLQMRDGILPRVQSLSSGGGHEPHPPLPSSPRRAPSQEPHPEGSFPGASSAWWPGQAVPEEKLHPAASGREGTTVRLDGAACRKSASPGPAVLMLYCPDHLSGTGGKGNPGTEG